MESETKRAYKQKEKQTKRKKMWRKSREVSVWGLPRLNFELN